MKLMFINGFYLYLLTLLFGTVLGKGGGGGGNSGSRPGSKPKSSSSNSGSSGSSTRPKHKRPPIVTTTSSGKTVCKDPDTYVTVPCPGGGNPNVAKIVGIVLGSVFGAIALGVGIFFAVRWWRNRRQYLGEDEVLNRDRNGGLEDGKGTYKKLEDQFGKPEIMSR